MRWADWIAPCLDEKTGKKFWSRNLPDEFKAKIPKYGYAWSPLVDGKKLILLPGGPDAAVAALDKTTGTTIWQGGGSDQTGYGSPMAMKFAGRKQYITVTAANVIGVDAANGTLLWSIPWKGEITPRLRFKSGRTPYLSPVATVLAVEWCN